MYSVKFKVPEDHCDHTQISVSFLKYHCQNDQKEVNIGWMCLYKACNIEVA